MLLLLWDASALVKRYALEGGSDTVDALFAEVAANQMATTFLGYTETYSSLLRKRNRGEVNEVTFRAAISLLQAEVLTNADFRLLTVDDRAVLDGVAHMEHYNLNASDAAILEAYLRYADAERAAGSRCVLVAADLRFIRAAQAEGLATLNPELVPAADVPALLPTL